MPEGFCGALGRIRGFGDLVARKGVLRRLGCWWVKVQIGSNGKPVVRLRFRRVQNAQIRVPAGGSVYVVSGRSH